MRPILYLFPIFALLSFASAGENDTLRYRYAVFFEHDGSVIDQYGLKYRISRPVSIFLRFRFDFHKADSDHPGSVSSGGSSFEAALGIDYRLADIDKINIFPSLFVGFSLAEYSIEYPPVPAESFTESNKAVGLSAGLGIGVEYRILEQWSLSGSQVFQVSYTETEKIARSGTYNQTDTFVRIPVSKLTLTFYF